MPLGLLLGVAVPIVLLVIFGVIPGLNKPAFPGGLTWFGVYFPILIAMVLATLSLLSLPVHLATYREQGILRRMSTTPVPPSWMLAAQVLINLALAVVAVGILVATKISSRDISLEEIQRRLSNALGHGYKVTATSDSTLKIRRAPLMTATVNVRWYEDGTTLQPPPAKPGSCRASTRSPSTRRYATPFPGRSRQRRDMPMPLRSAA